MQQSVSRAMGIPVKVLDSMTLPEEFPFSKDVRQLYITIVYCMHKHFVSYVSYVDVRCVYWFTIFYKMNLFKGLSSKKAISKSQTSQWCDLSYKRNSDDGAATTSLLVAEAINVSQLSNRMTIIRISMCFICLYMINDAKQRVSPTITF